MDGNAVGADRKPYGRLGESSSRATKRELADKRYTASQLHDHLDDVLLAEDTLAALEGVVDEREGDWPAPVILQK